MVTSLMNRALTSLLSATLVLAFGSTAALADTRAGQDSAAGEKALYVKTIEKYPAPKLQDVGGREYKVLFDPARTNPEMSAAFKELWGKVKSAAAKQGFTVTEKDKDALAIEFSTKEYFDTADQALWNKGFIVRVTTRYKDGKPAATVAVTVKSAMEDALKTLAVPLTVVGVDKVKTEAEENVGFGPEGALRGYVEKGSTFSLPVSALGKFTLADFGKYMPELLKLGVAPDAALVSSKAYSYRVRPGAVVLPGTEPCGVSMEAWAATQGGAPYLYDFSFGYGDLDFYGIANIHAAGEQFMIKVIKEDLSGLIAADSGKWGGSKVRQLFKRAIPAVAAAAAFAGPPVDPLDAKYGVASQPAYIKHYEADKTGKVILNPYLQVASWEFPALINPKSAPYNWVIDMDGNVVIIPEAAHPLGRVYAKGFFRPEDQSDRKPGTRENFGHVSALGGAPGRISGEILYDEGTRSFVVNNKSGRYSKHNSDRTPEQLIAAAQLIRNVVDPGTTPWGDVAYLFAYAPADVVAGLMKSPKLQYDDPKKKLRPHVIVMTGAPSSFKAGQAAPLAAASAKAEKPAAPKVEKAAPAPVAEPAAAPAPEKATKAKKSKAAHNDDPS